MCGQAHTNRICCYYFLGATLVRSVFAVIYNIICISERTTTTTKTTKNFTLCGQAQTNFTFGYYFLGATLIRNVFAVIYNTISSPGVPLAVPDVFPDLVSDFPADPFKRVPGQPRPQKAPRSPLWSFLGPSWASKCPRRFQDAPKLLPRASQKPPRGPQALPKPFRDLQESFRRLQRPHTASTKTPKGTTKKMKRKVTAKLGFIVF